jgi:spore germination cell wall hydrolase CwlJ-like protein
MEPPPYRSRQMTRAEIEDIISAYGAVPPVVLFQVEHLALARQLLAVMGENERLRGLAFTAYCEGYIAAGGKWQDDNGWQDSESRAALQGE